MLIVTYQLGDVSRRLSRRLCEVLRDKVVPSDGGQRIEARGQRAERAAEDARHEQTSDARRLGHRVLKQ